MPVTDSRIKEIKREDPVKSYCLSGWLEGSKLQGLCKPYAAIMYELSAVRGLLLRGHHIVIPSKMQADIIERLHTRNKQM